MPKTKIVELNGVRYQIRKMLPNVGSFILMKMLAAGMTAAQNLGGGESNQKPADAGALSGENLVRGLVFAASQIFDFETHAFVQKSCISVCSRMEGDPELPMPIVNDSGVWAIPEIRDDIALVMNLETEALIFNLSSFFDQGGMKSITGAASP